MIGNPHITREALCVRAMDVQLSMHSSAHIRYSNVPGWRRMCTVALGNTWY